MSKKYKNGSPRFYQIMESLMQLHSEKNKDYATNVDPLANFHRVAEICKRYKLITEGHESEKVALIYMLKQLDCVLALIGDNREGNVEGVSKRLDDIAVYSVLTEVLHEEGKLNKITDDFIKNFKPLIITK